MLYSFKELASLCLVDVIGAVVVLVFLPSPNAGIYLASSGMHAVTASGVTTLLDADMQVLRMMEMMMRMMSSLHAAADASYEAAKIRHNPLGKVPNYFLRLVVLGRRMIRLFCKVRTTISLFCFASWGG